MCLGNHLDSRQCSVAAFYHSIIFHFNVNYQFNIIKCLANFCKTRLCRMSNLVLGWGSIFWHQHLNRKLDDSLRKQQDIYRFSKSQLFQSDWRRLEKCHLSGCNVQCQYLCFVKLSESAVTDLEKIKLLFSNCKS